MQAIPIILKAGFCSEADTAFFATLAAASDELAVAASPAAFPSIEWVVHKQTRRGLRRELSKVSRSAESYAKRSWVRFPRPVSTTISLPTLLAAVLLTSISTCPAFEIDCTLLEQRKQAVMAFSLNTIDIAAYSGCPFLRHPPLHPLERTSRPRRL